MLQICKYMHRCICFLLEMHKLNWFFYNQCQWTYTDFNSSWYAIFHENKLNIDLFDIIPSEPSVSFVKCAVFFLIIILMWFIFFVQLQT